jgi:hypothetical protein
MWQDLREPPFEACGRRGRERPGVEGAGRGVGSEGDTGYRIPDTGYRIPDTGYRIPDTGYRIPDTGRVLGRRGEGEAWGRRGGRGLG